MSRVAIVTDSNSGLTQEEAKQLGIHVLPMPFIIDGQEYLEGINLTHEQFFEKMAQDQSVSTSQPSVGSVTDLWDEILKEADSLVYIPMSSGLSGSCQTAMILSEDYDGKVQVVNNQRISVTQTRSAIAAKELAAAGKSASEIKEILEQEKFQSSIYIALETLSYLKKGGRLTPAAAALGTALRLKPVLTIQGEKLDTHGIARTKKQGQDKIIKAIAQDVNTRFGGFENKDNLLFDFAFTDDREAALELAKRAEEELGIQVGIIAPLALSIACHIGPGAYAMTVTRKTPIE